MSAPPSTDAGGPVTDGLAAAVLDALPDATAVLDRSGTIIAVNRMWTMFALDNGGRPETTGEGVNYLDVCARAAAVGCADAARVAADLRAVLDGETVERDLEYPCPSPAGGRWFMLRITRLDGAAGGGAVMSHVNITRRKRAEQELAHEASHDPLTGLANRTLLAERLRALLSQRPGRGQRADVGLLYLDLDGFKEVNDRYGHDAGDEILLTTAHRLRSVTRPQDTIARLGGDEFVLAVPRMTLESLAALAARIDEALAEPHRVHGHRLPVPASIGIHLAAHGDTVADALRRADLAMYTVKHTRRTPEGREVLDRPHALFPGAPE